MIVGGFESLITFAIQCSSNEKDHWDTIKKSSTSFKVLGLGNFILNSIWVQIALRVQMFSFYVLCDHDLCNCSWCLKVICEVANLLYSSLNSYLLFWSQRLREHTPSFKLGVHHYGRCLFSQLQLSLCLVTCWSLKS